MFYRYLKQGGRIPVDIDGAFDGQTAFLAGGAPSLAEENLEALKQPGIFLCAMNNTATLFQDAVDLWIGGDKPKCYSPRILCDPSVMKVGVISRRDFEVHPDKFHMSQWKNLPNTYFIGTTDKFTVNNFLMPNRDFVWWKNTFYIALQLLHRLGFKKVYLIGCALQMSEEKQYSYDMKLDEDEQKYNTRLYGQTVDKMKDLKPVLDAGHFEVISATPDSRLNEFYPHVSFDEAIEDALKVFPKEYDMDGCVHSSAFLKEAKNG